MNRLNVINVGPTPPRVGGSAYANIETIMGLHNKGHRVRCVTCLSSSDFDVPDYDIAWRGSGIDVHPLEHQWIPSNVAPKKDYLEERSRLIGRKLKKLIREERPDVIMVGHESYSWYVNKLSRAEGIPVVQVLHGTPTHGLSEGVYPEEVKSAFIDNLLSTDMVIGVSKYLADIAQGFGVENTTYIYNGTDTNIFKPLRKKDPRFLRKLGVDIEDVVVLHASSLKSVKRPLDIVKSAQKVVEENGNVVYVVAGNGPLKGDMEDEVNRRNLRDNFRFVGPVGFGDMPQLFGNSDSFVLTSEREGFGRVIREAQACSVVPLASNVGPLEEVITHDHDGILFPKGDTDKLAEQVLDLAESREKRRWIGENARTTALATNFNHMVGRYEQTLEEVAV